MKTERRVYRFSAELFLQAFTTGNEIKVRVDRGIPSDSRVAQVWLATHPPTIIVVCERSVRDDTPSAPEESDIVLSRLP